MLLSALRRVALDRRGLKELNDSERTASIACCDEIRTLLCSFVPSQLSKDITRRPFPIEMLQPTIRDLMFCYLSVRELGLATSVCTPWGDADSWNKAYARRWGRCHDRVSKLSYALRDAYESRDVVEGATLAEETNSWLQHSYKPAICCERSYEYRDQRARVLDNTAFRAAAIERVQTGLLLANIAADTCATITGFLVSSPEISILISIMI